MNKLKPCPFCGGLAKITGSQYCTDMRWVICKDCHASTTVLDSEEEAIEAWNRRVTDGNTD